ncbi:hypothetical protein B0H11DRAFT_2279281 [Mycena galericulata]|nr:hypothetical protein B0H11DRAFT_2279281 [Mycena galericulata]
MTPQDNVNEPAGPPEYRICIHALEKQIGEYGVPMFPKFRTRRNRDATCSGSHRVRGGREHNGDCQAYVVAGLVLRCICPQTDPRAQVFYNYAEKAMTSNRIFGCMMTSLGMQLHSTNKEAGDTYETILGSLFEDLSYWEVQRYLEAVFTPLALVCLQALFPAHPSAPLTEKRKRVDIDSANADSEPPSKRIKMSEVSDGLAIGSSIPDMAPEYITSTAATAALHHILSRLSLVPRPPSDSTTPLPVVPQVPQIARNPHSKLKPVKPASPNSRSDSEKENPLQPVASGSRRHPAQPPRSMPLSPLPNGRLHPLGGSK